MATAGQRGFLDWVGYPVGIPGGTTPLAGYLGILDWTGIPCGVATAPTGHGAAVYGTKQLPEMHWERLKPFEVDVDAMIRHRRQEEEEFIALL